MSRPAAADNGNTAGSLCIPPVANCPPGGSWWTRRVFLSRAHLLLLPARPTNRRQGHRQNLERSALLLSAGDVGASASRFSRLAPGLHRLPAAGGHEPYGSATAPAGSHRQQPQRQRPEKRGTVDLWRQAIVAVVRGAGGGVPRGMADPPPRVWPAAPAVPRRSSSTSPRNSLSLVPRATRPVALVFSRSRPYPIIERPAAASSTRSPWPLSGQRGAPSASHLRVSRTW